MALLVSALVGWHLACTGAVCSASVFILESHTSLSVQHVQLFRMQTKQEQAEQGWVRWEQWHRSRQELC